VHCQVTRQVVFKDCPAALEQSKIKVKNWCVSAFNDCHWINIVHESKKLQISPRKLTGECRWGGRTRFTPSWLSVYAATYDTPETRLFRPRRPVRLPIGGSQGFRGSRHCWRSNLLLICSTSQTGLRECSMSKAQERLVDIRERLRPLGFATTVAMLRRPKFPSPQGSAHVLRGTLNDSFH